MSLSQDFQTAKKSAEEAQRAAEIARLNGAFRKFAGGFAGAAKGVAARAAKGKEPTWFQKRKIEKWVWDLKQVSAADMTPQFFEDIPGFRKLRDACADPKMDISCKIWISSNSINISVDPTKPFSTENLFSRLSDYEDASDPSMHLRPGYPLNAPEPAAPVATDAIPSDDDKISVMPQLRLKAKQSYLFSKL